MAHGGAIVVSIEIEGRQAHQVHSALSERPMSFLGGGRRAFASWHGSPRHPVGPVSSLTTCSDGSSAPVLQYLHALSRYRSGRSQPQNNAFAVRPPPLLLSPFTSKGLRHKFPNSRQFCCSYIFLMTRPFRMHFTVLSASSAIHSSSPCWE